ncbi:uncharacterized protein MKK02DRAFT_39604 [Dioszegia hungarica]|uniref:Uncharacterized protein n=1 Tax=Dioszegia hungarica TaxID=4972 RepID=A0AA38HFB9_9TREE|nr:uncharacterized protein MKK02DRAFT_39604 [Dioszegia hungarica]KAI9639306.1 hypothetical protein MKK02DRAFT_39604 [Dioszegia hungarica]
MDYGDIRIGYAVAYAHTPATSSAEPEPDQPTISGHNPRTLLYRLYYSRDFRTSDATREAIIQHVLGGWPGYTHRGYTSPSDWISTTESLDWAIWEVARRLVVLRRKEVGLALIHRNIRYDRGYKGNRNVVESAQEAIEGYGEDYWLDEDQMAALNFSRASSEYVHLGRIFRRDIAVSNIWTAAAPAYGLTDSFMQSYLKPSKQWPRKGGWLECLIFDPTEPFSVAKAKIAARRDQLERSRRPPRR